MPEGVEVEETEEGFSGSVELYVDEEGFFGRECGACERFFKLNVIDLEGRPDEQIFTCPYCGAKGDRDDFLTVDQRRRAEAALVEMAQQYVLEETRKIFSDLKKSSRGSGVEIELPSKPFPMSSPLPTYIEEPSRRSLACGDCGILYAVYGATAFCPICGPRLSATTILESIAAARRQLELEDLLPEQQREDSRAHGIFDQLAENALEDVVTLFEVYVKGQFISRVPTAPLILKQKGNTGNVFQRLEDADRLFHDNVGFELSSLVSPEEWQRLRLTVSQRHLLTHKRGFVDEQFLSKAPTSRLQVGQKLVISRGDAEKALDALERLVTALSGR